MIYFAYFFFHLPVTDMYCDNDTRAPYTVAMYTGSVSLSLSLGSVSLSLSLDEISL